MELILNNINETESENSADREKRAKREGLIEEKKRKIKKRTILSLV